jgi:hypothetical protein
VRYPDCTVLYLHCTGAYRHDPLGSRLACRVGMLEFSRVAARVTGVRGFPGRPRAACAVLSCAGAYVSGAAGSNACPAGSVRIETEAACRTAAATADKTFNTVTINAAYPRGCFFSGNLGNLAYLNTHAVGAGNSNFQLLCAAGAPARTDACMCAGICACSDGGAWHYGLRHCVYMRESHT